MTHAVASRYVAALADVVMEAETGIAPEAALDQLQAFGKVLEASEELVAVLTSPAVPPGEKGDLIADIGERIGLAPVVRSFLQVVVEHRRITHFGILVQGFRSWLDAYRNRVEIEVRVASEIDEDQMAALEQSFREITGKRVRASYVVDPELLGGTSVQVGSTLYDGSLRAALGRLAGNMATEAR